MAVKKVRNTRVLSRNSAHFFKGIEQEKQVTQTKVKNPKTLIIAQEIKCARLLASNDKKIRDKMVKNLKKWLTARSKSSFALTETDFMRLWKGLFYCMWMSDKPLIQEELAESLSTLVHCFDRRDSIVLYTMCALKTLAVEWFGIDHHRLDKFAMLVRRIVRQTFLLCKRKLWTKEWVISISEIFEKLFTHPQTCLGFKMHITELYLEELAKISNGNIPEDIITEFIKPFIMYLTTVNDERSISHISKHIFNYLIFQSEIGLDYIEKFKAWRQAGFPCENINTMKKIEISDEEIDFTDTEEEISQNEMQNTKKPLDPRAGSVNVDLPQLNFNALNIIDLLKKHQFHPLTTTTARRQIGRLINMYKQVAVGKMPLGMKTVVTGDVNKKLMNYKNATLDLIKFEEDLYSDAARNKCKKKKIDLTEHKNSCHDIHFDTECKNDNSFKNLQKNSQDNTDPQSETDTVNNLVKLKVADTNTLMQISKKKHTLHQTKKMTCTNQELRNKVKNLSEIKKSSLNNINKKIIKLKMKQNKHNTNALKTKVSTKTKRLKTYICGNWDVSDNIDTSVSSDQVSNSDNSEVKTVRKLSVNKLKSDTINNQMLWLTPMVKRLNNNVFKLSDLSRSQNKPNDGSNLKKRVKIVLQRNTTQHTSEYLQQIRRSPAIPFDANKKPLVGVLKSNPIPSPVNPFYRRNLK